MTTTNEQHHLTLQPHTAAVYLPLLEQERRRAAVFSSRRIEALKHRTIRPGAGLKPVPVDFSRLSLIAA